MSDFVGQIRELVRVGQVRISEHGYDEFMEDNLAVRELIAGVNESVIVEEYPDYPKGPCILLLQKDFKGRPVHVVWGIPRAMIVQRCW